MAVTPFRHIDFANHEPITKEKLDQYQSNVQWIIDHTPLSLHVNDSLQASISSLIIMGGRLQMLIPTTRYVTGRVYFGGAFESQTRPIVTLGLNAEATRQAWYTMSGIDAEALPDSRGFDISVYSAIPNAAEYIYVNWLAIGRRSPTYDSL